MGNRTLPTEYNMPRSVSTPLGDAIESFVRARWDLKATTKRGYLKSLERFARNHEVLGDLTADNVNDYLASIADHRTMARNDAIALRQLAQWATRSRIFPADPLASVSLPKGRGGKRKPFADADVPSIVKAAGESKFGPRDRAVIVLGLAAALRPAELWQLRTEDIDLRGGWVSVRRETTKSDSGERTIPLDPQAVAALDEYVSDYRPQGDGPLFLNARGNPFAYWGFMALFARLHNRLREQGIEFSAYRSRHTGITNWARAGVPAPILQQIAGHRSIVTTQNYIGRLGRTELARIPRAFTETYGRAV